MNAKLVGRVDIATITCGCGLGRIDFRFPDIDWRSTHPKIAEWLARFETRASMQATRPSG